MIVTRLNGGLGNQMFQYAAGLGLAHRNGDTLAIDASAFTAGPGRGEELRSFGLGDFRISAPMLSSAEAQLRRNPYGHLSRALRYASKKLLRRYYSDWHPEVMGWKGDVFLEGYFQAENYFADIATRVRSEFSLTEDLAAEIEPIARDIVAAPGTPVALHVRRGDYVSNPRSARVFNVCTTAYYASAISHIRSCIPDARFVVFSDDTEWVRQNLNELADAEFVSDVRTSAGNALRPSQEILLIAACRHAIISNSTFSWWGAWLNPDQEKIVIAPDRWTRGADRAHRNIVPASWTRLAT